MKRQNDNKQKGFFQKFADKWGLPDKYVAGLTFFGMIWFGLALLWLFFCLVFR
jgi:hypothetical protein